ncbi:NUDIX hydrolase [Streptomyces sp. F63]|uniref:NUDIX hydrolase n=1 Tax=Streptomyces sp. F63 TaxID=2824887 RepID=UPI001B37DA88|nr:NUDIX hydrolase [Streptomyces sp. F63]MBQ0983572.1 NUDIX hydrolase [Streptomyces sp. F63]
MSAHDRATRRRAALADYEALRERRPELFANPSGAAFRILLDRAEQERVSDEMSRAAVAAGLPQSAGDIGVVYRDAYFCLVRDAVQFADDRLGTYIRVVPASGSGGAAVLPMLADGRLVLLRHFRHADRGWHWEIPRGFGDPGEDGTGTAARELREELGIPVVDLTYLGPVSPDTGLRAGTDHAYLARLDAAQLADGPAPGARVEGIDGYQALSQAEFRSMVANRRISDAYTLSAYALAMAQGLLEADKG